MRYALAGLTLLAAAAWTGTPAQAHDRYYNPYYSPYPRYVVPAPRYYHPPPTYYYAPAPVYVYPRHRHFDRHRHFQRHHRPYHHTPQGSATFFFKF